ncbi:MAG: MFS transporter, partial [Bdellovibrionia bacterium]
MFTRSEKILLALLALIQFTHIVDFMIMMPLGPPLMRELSMSPAQFGWVISAYTFAAGIMSFMGAFFLDKLDRRRALIALSIGFAIGTLSCSLAPGFYFLMAARATAGAFGGVMSSTVLAIIGDSITVERRGRAMGVIMAAFSAASVLGVPFSIFLATHYSWHAPFIFLGVAALINTVAITLWLSPMTSHLGRELMSPVRVVFQLLATRETSSRLLFMALLIFGQFTIIPFLSPSLVANNGLPESQ